MAAVAYGGAKAIIGVRAALVARRVALTESGRGVITEGIAGRQVTFKTPHASRHLPGAGLTAETVESAVRTHVQQATHGASATGSFWGRVTVEGRVIEYRAFTLPDGNISVGTYYPVSP